MLTIILRSGWKATGLYPYDRSKALNSGQVRIRVAGHQPTTLPDQKPPIHPADLLHLTPKNQWNLYTAVQILQYAKSLPREVRVILAKAGKLIGPLTAQRALQDETIAKQDAQLQSFKIQKSKK